MVLVTPTIKTVFFSEVAISYVKELKYLIKGDEREFHWGGSITDKGDLHDWIKN